MQAVPESVMLLPTRMVTLSVVTWLRPVERAVRTTLFTPLVRVIVVFVLQRRAATCLEEQLHAFLPPFIRQYRVRVLLCRNGVISLVLLACYRLVLPFLLPCQVGAY